MKNVNPYMRFLLKHNGIIWEKYELKAEQRECINR
jgi:hypothetical protein